MSSNNPFENVKAGVESAVSKVASVAPAVKADIAKVEAAVASADSWLTAFIKNNAGKISIAILSAVGAAIWHYLL